MATATRTTRKEEFLGNVASTKQRALLLDYDGTLAPFCTDRLSASAYEDVPELLHAIMTTGTRVVLVTGRPAVELDSMLGTHVTAEIWGSHGLERLRPDGSYELAEMPLEAVQLLGGVDHCLEAEGLHAVMEIKPGATAVHWRGLSPSLVLDIRRRLSRVWTGLKGQELLQLCQFDGGMEFRLRWPNKGYAVRTILSEFHEQAAVAYLGDDITDEDAFLELKDSGLSVLVRPQFRPTAADIWLRPPDELLQFLGDWVRACGGEAW